MNLTPYDTLLSVKIYIIGTVTQWLDLTQFVPRASVGQSGATLLAAHAERRPEAPNLKSIVSRVYQ